MALTGAQKAQAEKKAQQAETKSAGLRLLYDKGYSVGDAKEVMGVAYGFAYGVARRHGAITPTPRVAKASAKASSRKTATSAAKPAPRTKAAAKRSSKSKAKAKA